MAILPIYTYGAPVLRQKAKPVTEITDEIIKLVMDMFETMNNAQGIGLAATQVGSLHRLLVLDISGVEGFEGEKPMVLINPKIVSRRDSWVMEEGCLSIPDIRNEVERSEHITVRFRDLNFEEHEIEAGELLARVILHELDHLDGVLFIDHLTEEQRKEHRDALKQIERGEMEVKYPVVTAVDIPA